MVLAGGNFRLPGAVAMVKIEAPQEEVDASEIELEISLLKRVGQRDRRALKNFTTGFPASFFPRPCVLKNQEAAEDVLQDVFIAIWERRRSTIRRAGSR